jgi:hypothetical protein
MDTIQRILIERRIKKDGDANGIVSSMNGDLSTLATFLQRIDIALTIIGTTQKTEEKPNDMLSFLKFGIRTNRDYINEVFSILHANKEIIFNSMNEVCSHLKINIDKDKVEYLKSLFKKIESKNYGNHLESANINILFSTLVDSIGWANEIHGRSTRLFSFYKRISIYFVNSSNSYYASALKNSIKKYLSIEYSSEIIQLDYKIHECFEGIHKSDLDRFTNDVLFSYLRTNETMMETSINEFNKGAGYSMFEKIDNQLTKEDAAILKGYPWVVAGSLLNEFSKGSNPIDLKKPYESI